MTRRADVLDRGYVRVRQHMGDDLTAVQAARVSYDKRADTMGRREQRLLRFLIENGHSSPLRHSAITYEVYAPLMVMRQWGKYRVGSVWSFEDSDDPLETQNESSRRYITEEPVFYVPDVWRSQPANSKQGSGPPLDDVRALHLRGCAQAAVRDMQALYEYALKQGVCPEQARLFLPAYALYVRSWWTVSLQGVIHFLRQRLADDAQAEIRAYAEAVRDVTAPLFPKTFELCSLTEEADEARIV